MKAKEELIPAAAKAMLAALFIMCVYRAVTQSIVFDEALTNELYVTGPLDNIFHHFDANHHFLNSVLMRLSASIFGDSELALRLPALGGAVLYFIAIYRIAAAVFGAGWSFLLSVGLLSLNPFTLDFMVAARGYGLGLALLMFGLALLLESFISGRHDARRIAWAGAALALSVTANLIFVLPAAAIAGLALLLFPKRASALPEKPQKRKRAEPAKSRPALWMWLIAPMAAVGFLFLLLAPVEGIRAEMLYTGAGTIVESLRSLGTVALEHSGPFRHGALADRWRDLVAFVLAPIVIAVGFGWAIRTRTPILLFTAIPIAFSGVALLAIHFLLGRPYPADRTGIYFAPLASLTLMGVAYLAKDTLRPASACAYALAAVLTLQFATEFNTRKFWVWEYDADTRTMGEYIASHRDPSAATVRVGGSWQLTESLGYYLFRKQWTWMEIEQRSAAPGYDFYVLLPQDAGMLRTLGLSEVYRGAISGSILAAPAR